MEKGREKCRGINGSGSKQRLVDGSSILGRGVVSFFFRRPQGGPQETSFETDAQGFCDED
jgi:hypothetical protein